MKIGKIAALAAIVAVAAVAIHYYNRSKDTAEIKDAKDKELNPEEGKPGATIAEEVMPVETRPGLATPALLPGGWAKPIPKPRLVTEQATQDIMQIVYPDQMEAVDVVM